MVKHSNINTTTNDKETCESRYLQNKFLVDKLFGETRLKVGRLEKPKKELVD